MTEIYNQALEELSDHYCTGEDRIFWETTV